MSAAAGQKVGRYTLTSLLGRGGMAEVYLAHDPQLDRDVAIKLILPQFAAEPGFGERFAHEARAVARLRHPNIVQVHDFDSADGRPYMVMELADGASLEQRLQILHEAGRPLPAPEVLSIASAIGSAIDYAHRQGMLHRDIKPSNILFTRAGEPLLADFGLAQITEQSLHTAVGTVSGTPAYMAPEQAQGKPEAASDLYSFAVVVYELLAGRTPFVGATPTELLLQHVHVPPPPPLAFRPELPPALGAVFQKALAKHPAERYASAAEFVSALSAALQSASPTPLISQAAPTVHAEPAPAAAVMQDAPMVRAESLSAAPVSHDVPTAHAEPVPETLTALVSQDAPAVHAESAPSGASVPATTVTEAVTQRPGTVAAATTAQPPTPVEAPPAGVAALPPLPGAAMPADATAQAPAPVTAPLAAAATQPANPTATPAAVQPTAHAEAAAPRPKPPTGEHLPRLVNRLGTVALVLAPLIGREKLPVNTNADDRRSAVASLMAILGIFLAALQFLSSALDMAYRVFAQLSQVLPVIIVLVLALGALVALQIMRRSASQPHRLYAAAVLTVIVLGGASWGGWQVYERARPPAGPIVLIADFQPCKGCPEVDYGQRILKDVTQQTSQLNLPNLEVRHVLETYPDSATARARGAEYKATLVIWGSYDTVGLLPHFELLRGPDLLTRDPGSSAAGSPGRMVRPEDLSTIDFHLGTGITETAFATVLALGLIRYAERDYPTALRVYNAALAVVGGDAARDVPNAEIVYYYKAQALYANGESWSDIADNLRKAVALKPSWAPPHYLLAMASLYNCTPDGKTTLDIALAESQASVQLRADANSYWLQGQVLAQLRRWADAAKSYEQSLKLQDDLEVRGELATAYRTLGRNADAAALLARPAPSTPAPSGDEVSTLRAKGSMLYAQGNYTDAVTTYQQAISRAVELKQPPLVLSGAYLDLADTLSAQQQYAAAAANYEKAESLWGKHWLGYYGLAFAYEQLGRTDEAIATYQKVVDDTPCDATAHSDIARLYLQQGKPAPALEEYQKAAVADPADGIVQGAIANILTRQGKVDAANAALRQAVKLLDAQLRQEPVNVGVAYQLGLDNLMLGDYAAALIGWQKYVALSPSDAAGHYYLASTLEALGRHADALPEFGKAAAIYQQAVDANPQNTAALRALAATLDQLQNYSESAKAYGALVRLIPGDAELHESLAITYFRLSRGPEALVEYRAAATLQPNNALFQTNLAWELAILGQNDEAIGIARQALQLDSGQLTAHYVLGLAYKAKGDKAQATAELQLVLQSPAASAGLRTLAEQALGDLPQ